MPYTFTPEEEAILSQLEVHEDSRVWPTALDEKYKFGQTEIRGTAQLFRALAAQIGSGLPALTIDGDILTITTGEAAWETPTFEPGLGNPVSDNYILSSTALGVRSWIANPIVDSLEDILPPVQDGDILFARDDGAGLIWQTLQVPVDVADFDYRLRGTSTGPEWALLPPDFLATFPPVAGALLTGRPGLLGGDPYWDVLSPAVDGHVLTLSLGEPIWQAINWPAFEDLFPVIAPGDIIFAIDGGLGPDTWSILNVDASPDGHVLTLAGGLPSWAAPVGGIDGSGVANTVALWGDPDTLAASKMTVSGTNGGTWTLYDDTLTIGSTQFRLRAGAGQAYGSALLELLNPAGGSATSGYGFITWYNPSDYYVNARGYWDSNGHDGFDLNNSGLFLKSAGVIQWSSITSQYNTKDAGLARAGVNAVKATNASTGYSQFRAQSFGVNNSAAATTLGTVTKKIEIFDVAGVSLGFLPVYDAIT